MEEEKTEKSTEELKKDVLEESVFNSAVGERSEDLKNIVPDEKKECGTQTLAFELEQKITQMEEEAECRLVEKQSLPSKEEKVQVEIPLIEQTEKKTISKVDKEEQTSCDPSPKIEKKMEQIFVKENEDEKIKMDFQKRNMVFNMNHLQNMRMNLTPPFNQFSILNNANIMSQIFRLGWNQWLIRNAMSGYYMNRFPF